MSTWLVNSIPVCLPAVIPLSVPVSFQFAICECDFYDDSYTLQLHADYRLSGTGLSEFNLWKLWFKIDEVFLPTI